MRRPDLLGQIPLLTLLALCVVTTLLTDRFLSPINLNNILVQSSIMAVIAMGMTFVIIGGGFDLSVGSTAALSACVAAMVMLQAGHRGRRDRRHPGRAPLSASSTASSSPISRSIPSSPRSAPWCCFAAWCFSSPAARRWKGRQACRRASSPSVPCAFLGIHALVWVPIVLLIVLSWVMHATPYGRHIYATGGGREAA